MRDQCKPVRPWAMPLSISMRVIASCVNATMFPMHHIPCSLIINLSIHNVNNDVKICLRDTQLVGGHDVRVSPQGRGAMFSLLSWSRRVSSLENILHDSSWCIELHVVSEWSSWYWDLGGVCRCFWVKVTLDAVINQSNETCSNNNSTCLISFKVKSRLICNTYSQTSVLASSKSLSEIHIEHGGTQPPASCSSMIWEGDLISGTICATGAWPSPLYRWYETALL